VIAAGNAAAIRHPVVDLVRPEMRRLAKDLGTECVGSAVVGNEILVMSLEGRPSHQNAQMALGQRIPLSPPLGEVFLAWAPSASVDRWLSRVGNEDGAPEARAHLRNALNQVRRLGYSVNMFNDSLWRISQLLTEIARQPARAELHEEVATLVASLGNGYEILDSDSDRQYDATLIAAPVFGADGSVVFAITLSGVIGLTGSEIVSTAARLTAVTLHVTRQIGGRIPERS
jgi:DNA-binding IclR family transcriptional regulator